MLLLLETEASEVDRTNCEEKGGSCKKPRDEARTSTGRGISWDMMRAMACRGECLLPTGSLGRESPR